MASEDSHHTQASHRHLTSTHRAAAQVPPAPSVAVFQRLSLLQPPEAPSTLQAIYAAHATPSLPGTPSSRKCPLKSAHPALPALFRNCLLNKVALESASSPPLMGWKRPWGRGLWDQVWWDGSVRTHIGKRCHSKSQLQQLWSLRPRPLSRHLLPWSSRPTQVPYHVSASDLHCPQSPTSGGPEPLPPEAHRHVSVSGPSPQVALQRESLLPCLSGPERTHLLQD